MPKVPTYEPRIIAALKQAGMEAGMDSARPGLGIAELASIAACSRQQVYKVIGRLEQAGMVREVGKGETGGRLYAWVGDVDEGTRGTQSINLEAGMRTVVAGMDTKGRDVIELHLDSLFRVMALRRLDPTRVEAELENEHGQTLRIVIEHPGQQQDR